MQKTMTMEEIMEQGGMREVIRRFKEETGVDNVIGGGVDIFDHGRIDVYTFRAYVDSFSWTGRN